MTKINNSFENKTFFIIDDDTGLANRLKDTLSLKKAKSFLAHNEEDAINTFIEKLENIDFIILDLMLSKSIYISNQIKSYQSELAQNRIKSETVSDLEEKLKLRNRSRQILSAIDNSIDKHCGLSIASNFQKILQEKSNSLIPLVFLSAIDPKKIPQNYDNVYNRSKYVKKPIVDIDELLNEFVILESSSKKI